MKKLILSILWALPGLGYTMEDEAVEKSIQEVKKRHEAQIMARPEVLSMGIGLNAQGQPAIIIGVRDEASIHKLHLPKELDGFPVLVQVVGSIRAQPQ